MNRRTIERNKAAFDAEDAEILASLAEQELCQERIITDGGVHYIFCGGYSKEPAVKTKDGWRCSRHRTNKEAK